MVITCNWDLNFFSRARPSFAKLDDFLFFLSGGVIDTSEALKGQPN